MKRTYYAIITVASFLLMAHGLSAQTSAEGRMFAKTWLHLYCFEAGTAQNEMQSFVADVVRGDPTVSFIYKFSPDGVRSTFATLLGLPTDLAFDGAGNLFVSDYGRGNIYKYKPSGARTTFASGLNRPQGLAFDGAGNLFVGETTYNGPIYRYKPDGTRKIFASGFSGQIRLACDSAGNLFVSGSFGDLMSGDV